MNLSKALILFFIALLILSCSKNEAEPPSESQSEIQIGDYKFTFPSEFELIEEQGIDSYVGYVEGTGISIFFDYGWYTSPVENLPPAEYTVTEDEVDGHFRQIVKPVDAETNYTRIHLYNIDDSVNSPWGYNSLTMSVNDLSEAEQALIIDVFTAVEVN